MAHFVESDRLLRGQRLWSISSTGRKTSRGECRRPRSPLQVAAELVTRDHPTQAIQINLILGNNGFHSVRVRKVV